MHILFYESSFLADHVLFKFRLRVEYFILNRFRIIVCFILIVIFLHFFLHKIC